ncbi:MAG: PEP-CTERM sorting domain-containing protein [Pirellulales bacterium]|nr:PEP-CTERM sorting domain-containing protein [Pirellulales bacterium]
MPRTSAAAIVIVCLLADSIAFGQLSFQGLGFLDQPGHSKAFAISADGTTVVGQSMQYPPPLDYSYEEGFRWTEGGGMVGLGNEFAYVQGGQVDLFLHNPAFSVSGDGSVIVGTGERNYDGEYIGYYWTESRGNVAIWGDIPHIAFDEPAFRTYGVSADGHLAAGDYFDYSGSADSDDGPFIVPLDSSGPPFNVVVLEQSRAIGGTAYGVSGDGTVVCGSSLGSQAFRWSSPDGLTGLGYLTVTPTSSEARAVSGDGATIVGWSNSSFGTQAFVWTQPTGMVGVAPTVGLQAVIAYATSHDGSVVVGQGKRGGQDTAFLFSESTGLQALDEYLSARGLATELAGWRLSEARGVSADGHRIAGWGVDPQGRTQAWVATVPEPSSALLMVIGGAMLLGRTNRRRMAMARIATVLSTALLVFPLTANADVSVSLNFDAPVVGTIGDNAGNGTGFTHRLPGTGGAIPANDPNLSLTAVPGKLRMNSTRSDFNQLNGFGRNLGNLEAAVVFVPGVGTHDFTMSALFEDVVVNGLSDQLTLLVGANQDATVRLGFHEPDQVFAVENFGSGDVGGAGTGLGAFDPGDNILLTVTRAAGIWSVSWTNQTNPATSGSLSSFTVPWLEAYDDLYFGIHAANARGFVPFTATIDNFTLNVVPEPSTTLLAMIGATAVGVVAARRRRTGLSLTK